MVGALSLCSTRRLEVLVKLQYQRLKASFQTHQPHLSSPVLETGSSLAQLLKENYENKREYSGDNLYRPENADV